MFLRAFPLLYENQIWKAGICAQLHVFRETISHVGSWGLYRAMINRISYTKGYRNLRTKSTKARKPATILLYQILYLTWSNDIVIGFLIAGIILIAILTAWSLALFVGSLRLMPLPLKAKKAYGVIVTVPFFIVPLTIILSTYAVIFKIASAHARGSGVRSFKKVSWTKMYYCDLL